MATVNFVTRTPLTNMLSQKEICISTCSFSKNCKLFTNTSVVLPSLQSSKRNSGISARLSSNELPELADSDNLNFPIMVNGCTGKMGRAVVEAAVKAGIRVIPISFGGEEDVVEVGGTNFHVHAPAQREQVLASVFDAHPDVIVIDYTVPDAVNANAELYCRVGVPFVMGTTGGDRERLHKTVDDAKIYAVISPQMGKQVVAFLAAMEIMAEKCPGAFSGYSLQSHIGALEISMKSSFVRERREEEVAYRFMDAFVLLSTNTFTLILSMMGNLYTWSRGAGTPSVSRIDRFLLYLE